MKHSTKNAAIAYILLILTILLFGCKKDQVKAPAVKLPAVEFRVTTQDSTQNHIAISCCGLFFDTTATGSFTKSVEVSQRTIPCNMVVVCPAPSICNISITYNGATAAYLPGCPQATYNLSYTFKHE